MSSNYTLKYRTFDTLMAEAYSDLEKYHHQGLIQQHQLIKVARRVNYDLGLRIYQTKEAVLELEKGRVQLPNDFYTLNFALLCGEYTLKQAVIQGTQVEEQPVGVPEYRTIPGTIDPCEEPTVNTSCTTCSEPITTCGCAPESPTSACNTFLNCKGEEWELIQTVKYNTRSYKVFYPLKITSSDQTIECGCPNLYMTTPNTAWIKDGWLYSNFDSATIYLNYQGMLEDDQGNVLVPDHEWLNEYYEYALKERILENLIMNDVPVSQAKFQIVDRKLRESRNNAKSLVNMPNFEEIKKVWQTNRKAQYSKYYDMFRSWGSVNYTNYAQSLGTDFVRQ